MNLKIIEARLRKDNALPASFQFYHWKMMPEYGDPMYCEFEGADVPLLTRGPRKGQPNYGKKTGVRKFAVGVQAAKDWEAQWSAETGKCIRCMGAKEIVWSVSVAEGRKYKACPDCKGTGNAKVEVCESTSQNTP